MHNGDGSDLKLVGGSRGEVVDLDLPRVGRVHRQLDPVRHSRVLLPIPERGEVETSIYWVVNFIFMPHSPVFLSLFSNCHNPIELIVTTCACGTQRTFPRFRPPAIDSHVRHDSRLTDRDLFPAMSAAVGWATFSGRMHLGLDWGQDAEERRVGVQFQSCHQWQSCHPVAGCGFEEAACGLSPCHFCHLHFPPNMVEKDQKHQRDAWKK